MMYVCRVLFNERLLKFANLVVEKHQTTTSIDSSISPSRPNFHIYFTVLLFTHTVM